MGYLIHDLKWYSRIALIAGGLLMIIPGTVSDVSATLVASTMRRPLCDWNTLFCSLFESRA